MKPCVSVCACLQEEYDFFLKGGLVMDRSEQRENPASDWLDSGAWDNITELDKLQAFAGIASGFEQATREWRAWYMSDAPEREPLPGEWDSKCSDLQRLVIIRSLRPDRVLPAATKFVAKNLSPLFTSPPPFDPKAIFNESTNKTPLVFVLSPGVDPTETIRKLAESEGMKLEMCALGQGQAPIATRMLTDGIAQGNWVFLQNCHLSISWMPTLEKMIEDYCTEGKPHKNFRLWLSSSPHPKFPISILQRGIKITTEPPRGLKANLARLYNTISKEQFNRCGEHQKYQRLLFCLCWFHSVLLERRKFKALGWNIPYDFNDSDFLICEDILALYLDEYEETPWEAIRYLIAEANYGGRITDDWDRRLCKVYVNQFFCEEALTTENYPLAENTTDYFIPDDGDLSTYQKYISQLPAVCKACELPVFRISFYRSLPLSPSLLPSFLPHLCRMTPPLPLVNTPTPTFRVPVRKPKSCFPRFSPCSRVKFPPAAIPMKTRCCEWQMSWNTPCRSPLTWSKCTTSWRAAATLSR